MQKDFVNPKAPVHMVTGNGGPPTASRFGTIMPWSHIHSTIYSYTRLVVYVIPHHAMVAHSLDHLLIHSARGVRHSWALTVCDVRFLFPCETLTTVVRAFGRRYNASTMAWVQVANNDSRVLTELIVTQDHHGPFAIPTRQ